MQLLTMVHYVQEVRLVIVLEALKPLERSDPFYYRFWSMPQKP
jgi:hypothetical protein